MSNRTLRTAFRPTGVVTTVLAAWLIAAATPSPAQSGSKAAAVGPKAAAVPTYTRDVAPILHARCLSCHRRGQVGPFALETYEQAKKRAADIAAVAEDRVMPPWKPAPGVGPKLKHDQSLRPEEVAVLTAWAGAGAPRGEAKHAQAPATFSDDWPLGTPDLVLEPSEDFAVPANGPDIYRCFVIPTHLVRDAHISAVDYSPGNKRVVHHVMAFIDTEGAGRERDAAEPGPGYTSYSGAGVEIQGDLGGWAAGNTPHHLPDGIGRFLPARSDVIVQVHYHPTGKPEKDRTRIGLYFSKTPVKRTLHWNHASAYDLKLPPGKSNIEVKATWYVPLDVEAYGVTPHMHALGKDFRMSVTFPNGKTLDLIHIPDWDPSWQSTYYFEKPVSLPRGSTVKVLAHYDNSAHARNPHKPPKLVKWGHAATDEMCVGYIGVVKSGQDLTRPGEKDDLFEIFVRQHSKNLRREQLGLRR